MIRVRNTSKLAGVKISGDHNDMEGLYETLYSILPGEGEDPNYEGSRIRVLGLCYDVRHALQGNREIEFVHNHMTPETMKYHEVTCSNQNVYYSFSIYYPGLRK